MKKDILLIAIVILGVAGLGAFFFLSPTSSGGRESHLGPVAVSGGSLEISTQSSLTEVTVDHVELVEGGFVTIHESIGPAPGETVGVSPYLPAGSYNDVVIVLDTPMIPVTKYIGLVRLDNGDQTYALKEDRAIKVNDVVVRADFLSSPEETP